MKDPRYQTIQGLLKAGAIKQFTDVFAWINEKPELLTVRAGYI
jgi:hypothetical protein